MTSHPGNLHVSRNVNGIRIGFHDVLPNGRWLECSVEVLDDYFRENPYKVLADVTNRFLRYAWGIVGDGKSPNHGAG
jgi:hypothetical protein